MQRVGEKKEGKYYLTDGLANWSVEQGELAAENWAAWLSEADSAEQILGTIGEEGFEFSNLREGVYLVQQPESNPEYLPFASFFLTIPEGENWDVYRAPKVIRNTQPPQTGDRPAPIIAAMGLGLSVAVLMVLVDEHKR